MAVPSSSEPYRIRHGAGPLSGRRLLALVAATGLVLALAIGGPFSSRAVAVGEPKLKVALTSDIDTLNPFLAIFSSSTSILRFQYESLVDYGTENQIVPGLSDKWQTSADGKTWTFDIPADRKWSDGQPLTAQDAAWTFNAVKTKPALQQANGGLVTNVTSVTAKDDHTLVMVLKAAQAANPGSELPIVPEHVWSKVNAAKYANDKDTVGSGPYVVTSYTQGQNVEMTTNQNFWRGPAKIGGLTYISYKSTDAAVQALRTGEVDLVSGLTPAQFKSLKGQQGITTNSGAGRRYQAIAINPGTENAKAQAMGDGNPALHDEKLRAAIVTAIDGNTLLTRVIEGYGKAAQTEVPSVYPLYYGYSDNADKRAFNISQANQMLDAAGYKKGSDGIRLDKSGKPLKLRLMGRNSDPTHPLMANYVKAWMKDIGISLDVSMVSPTQVNVKSTLGQYDLYFTGWGIGPDPDFQLSINRCSSRPNSDGSGATSENNYCDPAFDKLYDAQHTELDQTKRSDLVRQAFTMINNAAVNDVLFYADSLEAYRSDKFTGFTTQPVKGGVISGQNGYWGLYSAKPVSAATGSTASSGGTLGWAIGSAAVVLVIAAIIVIVVVRRRSSSADRE